MDLKEEIKKHWEKNQNTGGNTLKSQPNVSVRTGLSRYTPVYCEVEWNVDIDSI